jgi:hypothetical protein
MDKDKKNILLVFDPAKISILLFFDSTEYCQSFIFQFYFNIY